MFKGKEGKESPFCAYLTSSEEDEKLGMICTDAGYCKVPPYTEYPPNRMLHPDLYQQVAYGRTLSEFQIIYIIKGEGTFETQDTQYPVKAGSALLILPGIKHQYKPHFDLGWTEYWVGFKGEVFSSMLEKNYLRTDQVFFEPGVNTHFLSIFDAILDEISTQKPLYQIKACASIFSLIAELISRERRKAQPDYYQQIVDKTKYLMTRNIYDLICLEDIADELGLSTSRLNEIFKNYTGITPYQYFIDIKIYEAKMFLEQKIPVKEVACRLGFKDQYYFSRLFKSKTGVKPSCWK
jgi:AraC-like DNA-binding protein